MFPASSHRALQPKKPGHLMAVRRFSLDQTGEVLRKLNIPLDTAKAKDFHARHGNTLQKLLHDPHAPLVLRDDGAGGFTVERAVRAPDRITEAELPEGFAALALELAEAAPTPCLRLLEVALTCPAKADVLAAVGQAHAKATQTSKPVQTTMTASTTAATTSTTTTTATTTTTTLTMSPPELCTHTLGALLAHALGEQEMAKAIHQGDLAEVQALVSKGKFLLEKPLADGATPLQRAACRGQLAILNGLVQLGADPNKADACAVTPLHEAAKAGHVDAVIALLGHGARPNAAMAPHNATPLHLALAAGHDDVVRTLLGWHGIDMHARLGNCWTAVQRSIRKTPGATRRYCMRAFLGERMWPVC